MTRLIEFIDTLSRFRHNRVAVILLFKAFYVAVEVISCYCPNSTLISLSVIKKCDLSWSCSSFCKERIY